MTALFFDCCRTSWPLGSCMDLTKVPSFKRREANSLAKELGSAVGNTAGAEMAILPLSTRREAGPRGAHCGGKADQCQAHVCLGSNLASLGSSGSWGDVASAMNDQGMLL